MHPQVEWANEMEGRHVYGYEVVRGYWTRQWNLINPHVEPRAFQLDENQRIIVDVHQVIRDLVGKVLVDQLVQHRYTFENGLIRTNGYSGTANVKLFLPKEFPHTLLCHAREFVAHL